MHSNWTKLLTVSTLSSFAILGAADQTLAQSARARQFRPATGIRGTSQTSVGRANPALQPYLTRIQYKLNKNWYLPDGNNHVTLTVNVAPDGNATDAITIGNPKNQPAETAAMDAFNNSSPLEPLPSGVSSGKLILKFDSTADPHGDSHSNISVRFEPNPTAPPLAAPTAVAPATAAPQTEAPAAAVPEVAVPAMAAPEAAAPAMVPGTAVPASAYASSAAAAAAASVTKAAASAPAAQGIPSNAPARESLPAYVPPSAAATAQAATQAAAPAAAAPAAAAEAAPTAPPSTPATPADLLKSLP